MVLLFLFMLQQSSYNVGEEISLKISQTVIVDTIQITLDDIVIESMAPCPDDDKSYPSGSGVTIYLTMQKGKVSEKITLSEFTHPYKSENCKIWNGYEIKLISGLEENPVLKVSKEKIE